MSETPTNSRLVNGLGYLAITLLLILPLAVLTVRAGAWQQGLLLYALSCAGAALVLLVFVIMIVIPRYQPWRSQIRKRALLTVPGTLLLLSVLITPLPPQFCTVPFWMRIFFGSGKRVLT